MIASKCRKCDYYYLLHYRYEQELNVFKVRVDAVIKTCHEKLYDTTESEDPHALRYEHVSICDNPGLRDQNLTRIRNTKTDVTKYKFIAVNPNQSNC